MSATHFILLLFFWLKLFPQSPPPPPQKKVTLFSPKIFPLLSPQMVPNLDLILLAFLHGSFISFLLLLLLFLTLISLLLSFFLALFSILLIDSCHIYSLLSQYFGTLWANLQLGCKLILLALTHLFVTLVLALKPLFQGVASKVRVLMHPIQQIEAFKLAKIPGL